ncbi:MAG: aminotransferase class IV [Acidimicrobiales bacterium]
MPDQPVVWLNGELVPESEAGISPFDHGLLVGDGVFETCKVIGGQAFALTRHLDRLDRSAKGLGLDLPSRLQLRRAVAATIDANGSEAVGRLRIVVTGGPGPLGSARGDTQPTVVILAAAAAAWPDVAQVVVVPWPRNERAATAGLKTTSYAENVIALNHAHEHGASEAIFPNLGGNICEGTGTNIFVGLGGRLVTPPLLSGCLAGITRELLLESGLAEEADVRATALPSASEAFLTSSTREIQPISHIDTMAIAQCPGPLTDRALEAFAKLVSDNLDP